MERGSTLQRWACAQYAVRSMRCAGCGAQDAQLRCMCAVCGAQYAVRRSMWCAACGAQHVALVADTYNTEKAAFSAWPASAFACKRGR
jgi:hypothetical protein